jgi:hypothetical protein
MITKYLLLFIIIIPGKYVYGQQDVIIPGIGSSIWIQKNNTADTKVNVKVPFVDVFKNIYLWKPHLALGIGAGITSYNMPLNNQVIADTNRQISFSGKNTDKIKKYKLNTTYVELPVELRYSQNPDKHKTVFKVAIGMKVYYLVSSHTKTKYVDDSISKSKYYNIPYLNSLAYGPTIRLGWGHLGLLASYTLNTLFDEAHSPEIHQALLALCWTLSFKRDNLQMPEMPFKRKPDQSAYNKISNDPPLLN